MVCAHAGLHTCAPLVVFWYSAVAWEPREIIFFVRETPAWVVVLATLTTVLHCHDHHHYHRWCIAM